MDDCHIEFSMEKHMLKSDYDEVCFGLLGAGNIVSFSGENNKDLLVSILNRGIMLYPTRNMEDEEFNIQAISICENNPSELVAAYPYYNLKDESDYLIVSAKSGFLYIYKKTGEYPNIDYKFTEMLRDYKTNNVFNIPFENPGIIRDNLDGYREPYFSNYLYPIVYPSKNKSINYIVGDGAGNLWWIPEEEQGYKGDEYIKSPDDVKSKNGKLKIEKYGTNYTKPSEKICDEKGLPFLLGEGIEAGVPYKGAHTRSAIYENRFSGETDLIVFSGMFKREIFYLKRVGNTDKPAFRNLGKIEFQGFDKLSTDMSMHSKIIVKENDNGYHDILISANHSIAVFINTKESKEKPIFKFDRFIKDENALTSGNVFTTIVKKEQTGKRYIIDNRVHGCNLMAREIIKKDKNILLSSERIMITDQDGVFSVEGETDPNCGKEFGTVKSAVWDFDSKGKQNLIVGTDKGLLFLLKEDENEKELFKYTKVGPLKDTNGKVIKIHNRVCPGPIDLTANGVEDLIVCGAPYQMGCKTDPSPCGGVYYLLNKGVDEEGTPILEAAKRLKIEGFDFKTPINHVITVNIGDIDNDGEKEIFLSTVYGFDDKSFYKTMKNEIGIKFMGCHLPINKYSGFCFTLLDIDNDGELELVRAGGEKDMGFYYKKIAYENS